MSETSPFATSYRTHTCGELRKSHVGATVKLAGAIDRIIDPLTFVIRDAYGSTLVKIDPKDHQKARPLVVILPDGPRTDPTPESIVMIEGAVKPRDKPESGSSTGEIYVEATLFDKLSTAKEPLVCDYKDPALSTAQKVRHRYLYLRHPRVHEAFAFRTRLLREARRFLVARGFVEVETPILDNRWTPESADGFVAVRERARLYALPGRRPAYSALLGACGFDRAVELSRRFVRQDEYGPFEQPEYSVLAMHLAFVDDKDLFAFAAAFLGHLVTTLQAKQPALAPVTEPTYFTHDDSTATWNLTGDPLIMPVEGDLEDDPHHIRMRACGLVMDGIRIGSASLRNHDLTLQRRLFTALGLKTADVDARWGRLLEALKFGVPPHGRIEIGIDRLTAVLLGLPSIDEVIALPKASDGTDPLARSPWPMNPSKVRGLLGV